MPPVARSRGIGARIRGYFFTGLIVAGPLAVTAWLVWWFVDTVDHLVKPLIPERFWPDAYLPKQVPGIGVVLGFVGLTLLGFLTANLVGRTLLRLGETILERMPVVRGIYKGVKQLFETLFSQSGTTFRRVGLVEFPRPGQWSIVLISSPPTGAVADALGDDTFVSVFLPCTPNPTTGFFYYLPVREVIELDISPDEAAKLIMSAGVIQPELRKHLDSLPAAAARKAQAAE